MTVKRIKIMNAKLLTPCLLIIGMCSFSGSAQNQQLSIEQQILQISSADQAQTLFNNSKSAADQITIIELLPGVINRFKVNPASSMPTWLNNVLTQALNSTNADVANAAISQVGSLQAGSLADNLIAMYGKAGNSIGRVKVIRALGDMASSKAIPLLKSIIDSYVLCLETDEAVISARKMCAAGLVSDISAYCSNLDSRIKNGEFVDPKTMPLTSPEVSLMIAKGSLQVIANGSCGQ